MNIKKVYNKKVYTKKYVQKNVLRGAVFSLDE